MDKEDIEMLMYKKITFLRNEVLKKCMIYVNFLTGNLFFLGYQVCLFNTLGQIFPIRFFLFSEEA